MGQVGYIGLGVMGGPMARHLATKGHDVTVYNRTEAKAERFVEMHGGWAAETPAEAADDADFVFLCVGNDDDVRSVALGPNGALRNMKRGSVLIDHTTASADVAREVGAAAAAAGVGFIDAPVSGGQVGAENGLLTVMCGCDDLLVFQKTRPVISLYAQACKLMGGVGSGQLTKMVNQLLIAGIVQGLAEGVNFANRAGLEIDKVVEIIGKGAAASWQLDNRAITMSRGEFNFGFAVELMRKDLGICFAEGERIGAQTPLAHVVDGFYEQIVERGGRRWDTSSLINLLAE
jgi:3-hydroxyisobutyrate dehydrogenase-like beta-hydroxyacid dehydrogenase